MLPYFPTNDKEFSTGLVVYFFYAYLNIDYIILKKTTAEKYTLLEFQF